MAELIRNELDSLPVPLDFGPVLKTATQTGSKRASKRAAATKAGNGARGEREVHTLTRKHPTVKHLYQCERSHRWQWVPEKRLSLLWHSLDNEERARVVQTHERDQLTKRFREELESQMCAVECHASESAKSTLAAMIWCDQSGLALFKRIFIVAVEQNHPMVIDMEVIAAVDAVIQDFCASVMKLKQSKRWPCSVVVTLLMCIVMAFWVCGSSWTWLVALVAMGAAMHSVWRSLPPLDPRSFDVGTDLWVQYREREHVRLMWMSATVRVFEVRLLRILERRRRAAKQAEAARRARLEAPAAGPDTAAKTLGECTDGPVVEEVQPKKKYLGQRRLMRRRKAASSKAEADGTPSEKGAVEGGRSNNNSDAGEGEEDRSHVCRCDVTPPVADVAATTTTADSSTGPALDVGSKSAAGIDGPELSGRPAVSVEAADRAEEEAAEEEVTPQASPPAEGAAAGLQDSRESLEMDEGDFHNEDGGDEIDAEFAWRVQEHFQNRVHAAGKDLHSQTDRGNQILKSLCEKLKMELERATVHI